MTWATPMMRAQAVQAAQAESQGQALQWPTIMPPMPPGRGLAPVNPALLVSSVRGQLPDPAQLVALATDAARQAAGIAQALAPFVATAGGALAAASPLVGKLGVSVAPALSAVPYVGPALSGVAALAGPIAGVAGVVGAGAGAAAGASPALVQTGADVVAQLDKLSAGNPAGNPPGAPGSTPGG